MPDVLTDTLAFGEGPAFDPNGDLWCTEVHGGTLVHRHEGEFERHLTNGAPSAIKFDDSGRAVVCDGDQNAVRRFEFETLTWETLIEGVNGEPLRAPNDLAFGPDGELVFTCPGKSREDPIGYLTCLRPDGTATVVGDGYYFPNGLAFTEDGEELVVAETFGHRLWKGDWDSKEFAWRDPEIWCEVGGPVGPDGMAFADDGRLFVAVFGTAEVRVVAPDGSIQDRIHVPGRDPTNVAFD
ncbi:MAG: SMP-30/gluconolactonase/LRE family protein, partial [Halobacteriales archaeon]